MLLLRVSTKKGEQATSLDRQRATLRRAVKFRGWKVADELVDRESGFSMSRPGALAALELVRRRRADVLVVDSIARFGRNVKEMLEFLDELNACGGHFYDCTTNLDTTTPGGRMLFTMVAAIGEFYVREGRDKIKAGQARARARGKIIGRPRTIDHSKTERARALRAEGATWSAIASKLGGKPGAWSRRLSRA